MAGWNDLPTEIALEILAYCLAFKYPIDKYRHAILYQLRVEPLIRAGSHALAAQAKLIYYTSNKFVLDITQDNHSSRLWEPTFSPCPRPAVAAMIKHLELRVLYYPPEKRENVTSTISPTRPRAQLEATGLSHPAQCHLGVQQEKENRSSLDWDAMTTTMPDKEEPDMNNIDSKVEHAPWQATFQNLESLSIYLKDTRLKPACSVTVYQSLSQPLKDKILPFGTKNLGMIFKQNEHCDRLCVCNLVKSEIGTYITRMSEIPDSLLSDFEALQL